ncbi:hypothetical protein MNBD_GAMMA26-620 [hydrothermal vent metagenome]|uniref:Hemerythrin-like domain-containing protein n=1 Tax=hydrothermal vent metagenome TaxID=652676 RepID=A0A3B1BML1_9ZZZZ
MFGGLCMKGLVKETIAMSIIKWDPDMFSVKDPNIDDQHKTWISILNSLYNNLTAKGTAAQSRKILNAMLEYTQMHFATEEKLMLSIDYPKYKEHKVSHDRFIDKLTGLKHDLDAEDDILGIDLQHVLESWLKHWLVDHIINMDKQYSAYLPAK